eukprot:TRINITY_DN2453_c0_g1_i2.p1 TRINITY_DN2453_c0_g1~~TRINITY_DN2453_c0_g1_i2.p1  ORF type:complete len:1248 (-),score=326.62 TRINITY_DN2453_c0_g1_i2:226-3969(-)
MGVEHVIDLIAEAVANLVITLSENKSGNTQYVLSIEAVKNLKSTVDNICDAVDDTLEKKSVMRSLDTSEMLRSASAELNKQATNILSNTIAWKKAEDSSSELIDACLGNAKAILKAVVNLVLIEDRANLDTLSWFVKEVAMCVRDVNNTSNEGDFGEACRFSTDRITILVDFVTNRMEGSKYPEQKERLKERVKFVTDTGPKKHWPAVAACINNPFDQDLQIAKEEAAEEIVTALEEIAEIIREMYEALEAFIDAAFKRPAPLTLRKQNLMDRVKKVEKRIRRGLPNDDESSLSELEGLQLRKLPTGQRGLAQSSADEALSALQDFLKNLKHVDTNSKKMNQPTGTHPNLDGALKRLRRGSRATRNVNPSEDPDAAGLAKILNALNNLRHMMGSPEDQLAFSRNCIIDALDDGARNKLAPGLRKLVVTHRDIILDMLDDPLRTNYEVLKETSEALENIITDLTDMPPGSPWDSDNLRALVEAGVTDEDILRTRELDVQWHTEHLKDDIQDGVDTEQSQFNVMDAIKRHIAAARAARERLNPNRLAAAVDAESDYQSTMNKFRNLGMGLANAFKGLGDALKPAAYPEDKVVEVENIVEELKFVGSKMNVASVDGGAGADEKGVDTPNLRNRKALNSRLLNAQRDVASKVGDLDYLLQSTDSDNFDQVIDHGARILDSIRRHIAAARKARAALAKDSDKKQLDNDIEKLTKHARTFGSELKSFKPTTGDRARLRAASRGLRQGAHSLSSGAERRLSDLSSADPMLHSPLITKGRVDAAVKKVKKTASDLENNYQDSKYAEAFQSGKSLQRALGDLREKAHLHKGIFSDESRRNEIDDLLKELDGIIAQLDDRIKQVNNEPPPNRLNTQPLNRIAEAAVKLADQVYDRSLISGIDNLTEESLRALQHLNLPTNTVVKFGRTILDTIAEIEEAIEHVDDDGNITVTLTLNRQNQARYNKFLAAVKDAQGIFQSPTRKGEVGAAYDLLAPALKPLNDAINDFNSIYDLELSTAAEKAAAKSHVQAQLANAKKLTKNAMEVASVRPGDQLQGIWGRVSAAKTLPTVKVPISPADMASISETDETEGGSVQLDEAAPLNVNADPAFLTIASKMRSHIESYTRGLSSDAGELKKALEVGQEIAGKISELGAAINDGPARVVIENARAVFATIKTLRKVSEDFLAKCKDERLKEQYLIEVRAIESLGTQLKILSTVCASQGDDPEAKATLVALTEKIAQATQRALRAGELCALASH